MRCIACILRHILGTTLLQKSHEPWPGQPFFGSNADKGAPFYKLERLPKDSLNILTGSLAYIVSSMDASFPEHDSHLVTYSCIGWPVHVIEPSVVCTVALLKVVVALYE